MLNDIRSEVAFSSTKETALDASCVCGCGCNCTCGCLCFLGVNQQANYSGAAWNNNQTGLNNRWYNNAVAGQGP